MLIRNIVTVLIASAVQIVSGFHYLSPPSHRFTEKRITSQSSILLSRVLVSRPTLLKSTVDDGQQTLLDLFNKIDADNSGEICESEVRNEKAVLGCFACRYTNSSLRSLLAARRSSPPSCPLSP